MTASGNHSAEATVTAKMSQPVATKVSWGVSNYESTATLTAVLCDSTGKEKERQSIYPRETYTFSSVAEGDYLNLYHPDDWVLSKDNGPYESVRGIVSNLPAYNHQYSGCDTP